MLRASVLAAVFMSLSLVACSEDDSGGSSGGTGGHGGTSADCTEIIEACHTKDNGDPSPINTCHQAAHANKMAECTSEKAKCVALCKAAPDVDGGKGGAGGHAHGGAGGHQGGAGGHHQGGAGGHHQGGAGGHAHDGGAHDASHD